MKTQKIISFALMLSFLMMGCEAPDKQREAVDELVNRSVAERIEEYRQIQLKNCRNKVLTEANRIVDSILILEARLSLDTLPKPPKPEKPEKPEIKMLEDTQRVEPFFKKDTLNI